MKKPESKCPECGNKINWEIITGALGAPQANGICTNCNIVFRGREAPEIAKGKKMAKDLEGISCLDKRITRLSCNAQLGILRARQRSRRK